MSDGCLATSVHVLGVGGWRGVKEGRRKGGS
jgi:hypothetical protein